MTVYTDPDVAYMTIEGIRYAYRRAGQGPALILLHGLGETSRVFWRELFANLSDQMTLIALDLLGFGDTDAPTQGYQPAAAAHALHAFVSQLGLDKPMMLGHSLGGIIATRYALLFPDKIAGLILYSTPIPGDIAQNLTIASSMPFAGVALMGLVSVPLVGWLLHQNRTPAMIRMLVDSMRVTVDPADYTDEMVAEGMRASYEAVTQWVQHGFLLENQFKDIHRIQAPTLLIQGEHDVMPAEWMDKAARTIPNAQRVTIHGAAHTALAERPAQFIDAVRHFTTTLV